MIVYKMWKERRFSPINKYLATDTWLREGWFLFGFIPLYVRDVQNREKR